MTTRSVSLEQYEILIAEAESEIRSADTDLADGRELALQAGLSTEGELTKAAKNVSTGGHSNTDHRIVITGDYAKDRIAELSRRYLTRQRSEQPESRGEDRWDKPRVPGERRRRIAREKDLPAAPPEPPMSGYILFVSQMTTKLRHDRINEPHSQTKVVQEISRMWKYNLSENERKFYNDFSDECRQEYKRLSMEFRATAHFTPSEIFERIQGVGPWIHKRIEERNDLEREIATYDTVVFPMRPPEMDEDYKKRDQESKARRKAKLKAERDAKIKMKPPKRKRKAKAPPVAAAAAAPSNNGDAEETSDSNSAAKST